jgi:hypothetical protein
MPLLTELENERLELHGYKHGAPNGAVQTTQRREMRLGTQVCV